jgi:hypothetical protein
VAWLCDEAERRLKQLTAAALRLTGPSGEAVSRSIQVLMNGVAPGSLYIGFSVGAPPEPEQVGDVHVPQLFDSSDVLGQARMAIGNLVLVPRFVRDADVDAAITEAISDPELRDATLMAAYHLAPSGRRGVHTIEITAPRRSEPSASFTNRERVVLRDTAVRMPVLKAPRRGSFVGEHSVGTLRCALDDLSAELARKHIGAAVKVTGMYEVRADGRPGLMQVASIAPHQKQSRLRL